jgi:hypothetical protein
MPFIIPLPLYDTKNIDAKTALNKKTMQVSSDMGFRNYKCFREWIAVRSIWF